MNDSRSTRSRPIREMRGDEALPVRPGNYHTTWTSAGEIHSCWARTRG